MFSGSESRKRSEANFFTGIIMTCSHLVTQQSVFVPPKGVSKEQSENEFKASLLVFQTPHNPVQRLD